ncbi:MAG: zinc-ribbon domain-containing protein [Oscillospiraceae bacterium]|nr:zinc-ribbon domain-containing protein [Oscillospiraceae bacterium]
MYCSECGKELRDGAKFCSFCGTMVANDLKAEEMAADNEETITAAADIEEITDVETVSESTITEEIATEEKAVEDASNNDEITEAASSEFAEKFHEKDGLFVVKEQTSDISCVNAAAENELTEKVTLPWVKISAVIICFAVMVAAAYFIPNTVVPTIKYSNAQKLYESGDYQGAKTAFAALDGYKDSDDYILKCAYGEAEQLFSNKRYPEAADAFTALDGYSDSDARAMEAMLKIAENYIAVGEYDSAMSIYAAAGKADLAEQTALQKIEALAADRKYFEAAEIAENYCSEDVVTEYRYQGALAAKNAGDYKTAADNFYKLGGYSDSAELAKECTYSFYMTEYTQNGASEEIARGFYFLGDFNNSHDMFIEASYEYGLECAENGNYASAVAMFKNCGTHKSAMGELYKARYNLGKFLLDSDPASARSVFALLSTYSDSSSQKKIAASRLPDNHEDWYADGFTSAGSYYTTVFRKTDTLLVSCTAGTETISEPVTLTLTFRDSNGTEITADCENVRNSASFSGSFSLASSASGDAKIIIARKDNGTVLRTIVITVME